jgi:hypothetical protein
MLVFYTFWNPRSALSTGAVSMPLPFCFETEEIFTWFGVLLCNVKGNEDSPPSSSKTVTDLVMGMRSYYFQSYINKTLCTVLFIFYSNR